MNRPRETLTPEELPMKTNLKSLMTIALALTLNSASALANEAAYLCSMGEDAKPHYTFLITVTDIDALGNRDGVVASIQYQRNQFYGSEEMSPLLTVPGCGKDEHTYAYAHEKNEVYVECAGDGDAGFISIKTPARGEMTALLQFPNGNLEFNDEDQIALTCRKF